MILPVKPVLDITRLTKRYEYRFALRDVTTTLNDGEVFGLLGPNGSGKTTLLRVLATLTPATSGSVKVGGVDLFENGRALRRTMGYLAHDSLLYRDLTGEENIVFFAQFYQVPNINDRFDDVLALLELAHWRHEAVKNLSKGLQKRFNFVRAIIHDPQLLLLDEPFSGLDLVSSDLLSDYINSVRGEKTVILSTHDFNQARCLCDRVGILMDGQLTYVLNGSEITDARMNAIYTAGATN
jgi:ABC-type multidrug transport system ATPase subunit